MMNSIALVCCICMCLFSTDISQRSVLLLKESWRLPTLIITKFKITLWCYLKPQCHIMKVYHNQKYLKVEISNPSEDSSNQILSNFTK